MYWVEMTSTVKCVNMTLILELKCFQRSAMTVEELAESSRVVTETHEEFKGMGAVLGHSRLTYILSLD